jgi:glycosyl hydrolase family 64 (putative beta-1,3-glucanase)
MNIRHVRHPVAAFLTIAVAATLGCGPTEDGAPGTRGAGGASAGASGVGPSGTTGATTGAGTGTTGSGSSGNSGSGASGATGGGAGSIGAGGAGGTGGAPSTDAGPAGVFWDATGIPAAKNVMIFRFLNRTNGKYQDSEVFWSFKAASGQEVHSIADQPMFDMPANSSGRMYFYLGAPNGPYFDFIEFTIGATRFNGNTTRVDAFGLKIAMRLHSADGSDVAVGEDYPTFQEDRAVTFQKFVDEVPDEFKALAQIHAPYRIVEPGAGEFKTGGANEHYYDAFVNELWAANGLTIPKPGANGSGLGAYPNISAAIFRHMGQVAGSFTATGALLNKTLWSDSALFYGTAPANYYAKFWHERAINGKAYGFPYDDVGGYSTFVAHDNPQYILIAIGW